MPNNYTYFGSAAVTASGFTQIFNFRYPYLLVTNLNAADIIYITTDGKTVPTATTPGDGIYVVNSDQSLAIPNLLPLWYPSASVIPKGTLQGTGPGTGTPYESGLTNNGSLWGQTADPGVVINFITNTGTTNFTVIGMG